MSGRFWPGQAGCQYRGAHTENRDIAILGASSDHLIIDVTDAKEPVRVGDRITFKLNYQGLLTSCSSKYIKKVYI